jgi:multiple sugar transport system substrate-binding protein
MKKLVVTAMLVVGLVSAPAFAQTTIRYMLWDTNQMPPYLQCAADFEAQTGIKVEIEQLGWGDYWTTIQTGFVSGETPDVFTNHLAKYPEFVELGQLVDLQPWVEAEAIATDVYYEGLADLWTKDGGRYGLPKDWDTIAVIYNADALAAAGVSVEELNNATWNPTDGGSFENIIARLTLDSAGRNGLDPAFDANNIVQYGFTTQFGGGAYGQTEWSWLTASNGFTFNNGVWGDEYYYDDPRLAEALSWLTGLWLEKPYSPSFEDQNALGRTALFQAGTIAMTTDGSWMIGTYLGAPFEVGFARLPIGPEGRKSMFNGLADSIWIGTDHPDESWAWVKYLASLECQNIVGASGVVFPAIPAATALSLQVREAAGVDVSAFTLQAGEEGGTFLFPITDYGAQINTIMTEAIESIGLGLGDPAEILRRANREVNDLF